MTELLSQAIERAKTLPKSKQDALARVLLAAIDSANALPTLSAAQLDDLEQRLIVGDEFVPAHEVRAELVALMK